MTPEEQQQVRNFNAGLDRELTLRLRESDHAANQAVAAFLEELASLAPKLRVVREKEDPQPAPAIMILDAIAYSGVPSGTEFEPFVELLSAVGQGSPSVEDGPLAAIGAPAMLKLYVSAMCPHCPAMFRQIFPLSLGNGNVKLTVIDGPTFPELAAKDNIKSLPTLLLDGNFRWTAAVDTAELLPSVAVIRPSLGRLRSRA